jgi:hypothetical protein
MAAFGSPHARLASRALQVDARSPAPEIAIE